MNNATRAMVGVVAIALAVVLFVALRDEDDGPRVTPMPAPAQETRAQGSSGQDRPDGEKPKPAEKEPEVPVIEVEGGQPVGGVQELAFRAGDQVRFEVESDVADELHLHGYDISKPIKAGGRASFDFEATIEGVFEVELEERAVPVAELTVNPD